MGYLVEVLIQALVLGKVSVLVLLFALVAHFVGLLNDGLQQTTFPIFFWGFGIGQIRLILIGLHVRLQRTWLLL